MKAAFGAIMNAATNATAVKNSGASTVQQAVARIARDAKTRKKCMIESVEFAILGRGLGGYLKIIYSKPAEVTVPSVSFSSILLLRCKQTASLLMSVPKSYSCIAEWRFKI